MTLADLFFLASVLLLAILCGRIAISLLRRRWGPARRLARLAGVFLACYAMALMAVALLVPRHIYAPGQRRCFDDWCVAAVGAEAPSASAESPCPALPGSRTWVAVIEVSSVARRIRQRARDARAELEDRQGRRYQPCAAPLRPLSDELGPGESFRVTMPFRLPNDAQPAGLVVHHGDFPGILIIGADQSFLHTQALQSITLKTHI